MIITYLILMFAASVVNLFILYYLFPKKRLNAYYTSIFHFLIVAQLGHVFLALSTNIEEALLANKIAYIGAAFFPMLAFLGVLDVCQIKVSRKIYTLLFLPSLFVFATACTAGFLPWYYISAKYVVTMGVGNFEAEFGPLHLCFNLMILFYMFACLGVWFYAFIRKKKVSLYNLAFIAIIGIVCGESFFVSRKLGSDMLVMPAVYVIIEIILLFMACRMQRYDLSSLIFDEVKKNEKKVAYVSITSAFRYVGANEKAQTYFPELNYRRIDSELNDSTEVCKAFREAIVQTMVAENSTHYFHFGNDSYKCQVISVSYGGKSSGYLLRIEKVFSVQNLGVVNV